MAQEPAVPKHRRAALRAATVLGLSRAVPQVPSEAAALALRKARKTLVPAPKHVRFLIPMVGPHHVGDWESVTQRLSTTLQGFLDQDDPRWQAVICCQDRPPLPDDPRIRHLPFDDPTPGNDKWRKLAALCEDLTTTCHSPTYVMSFDADDLLHRGAVGHMLRLQAPGGYLVEQGYVMDHATGAVAMAQARSLGAPLQKPFWKLCGSCMALPHDPALRESANFLRAMTQHEHRMFPYLARLAGYRPQTLTPPSVLYVLNHGENFGARRGRVGFKTRFVERYRRTEPAELSALDNDFPKP